MTLTCKTDNSSPVNLYVGRRSRTGLEGGTYLDPGYGAPPPPRKGSVDTIPLRRSTCTIELEDILTSTCTACSECRPGLITCNHPRQRL